MGKMQTISKYDALYTKMITNSNSIALFGTKFFTLLYDFYSNETILANGTSTNKLLVFLSDEYYQFTDLTEWWTLSSFTFLSSGTYSLSPVAPVISSALTSFTTYPQIETFSSQNFSFDYNKTIFPLNISIWSPCSKVDEASTYTPYGFASWVEAADISSAIYDHKILLSPTLATFGSS